MKAHEMWTAPHTMTESPMTMTSNGYLNDPQLNAHLAKKGNPHEKPYCVREPQNPCDRRGRIEWDDETPS